MALRAPPEALGYLHHNAIMATPKTTPINNFKPGCLLPLLDPDVACVAAPCDTEGEGEPVDVTLGDEEDLPRKSPDLTFELEAQDARDGMLEVVGNESKRTGVVLVVGGGVGGSFVADDAGAVSLATHRTADSGNPRPPYLR